MPKRLAESATNIVSDTVTNIIQIVVVVLLVPIAFFILSAIKGTREGAQFLMDVIGEVEVFDVLMDFASTCIKDFDPAMVGDGAFYLPHVERLLEGLNNSIIQVFSVSLGVRLCVLVSDIFHWPGIRILPSVLGVILGYTVVLVYPIPIMALGFLFLLMVVLDMIFLFGRRAYLLDLIIKYVVVCLKAAVEMITVIFMTGFVAVLLAIWQGSVTNIAAVAFLVLVFAVPWFGLLAINRYLVPLLCPFAEI